MFSDLSLTEDESVISYPILDSHLPFSDYIKLTRQLIEERRPLDPTSDKTAQIIEANSPFEFYPEKPLYSGKKIKYGALLIHGLLDCPLSLRDIGMRLQTNGILSRAILLPGHGTTPKDLLRVSYHDWIQAVRYGVDSLRETVENIYLIGYSTGATLSVYQALQDNHIAGIVLLSPAIKIKAPVDIAVAWHKFLQLLGKDKNWMYRVKEIDYAKYLSIPFNAINQVSNLIGVIRELREHHALNNPIFMVMSREDETISSHRAIDFFSNLHNADSRLLLYTSIEHRYPDPRIVTRMANYPNMHINHCSHISIPFAPSNSHYGIQGDYKYASHIEPNKYLYGAYNRIEQSIFNMLYNLHVTKYLRRELTFNPDFDYMSNKIVEFISGISQS